MIYYFTPFAVNKNLGAAYNHYAGLVKNPDDWICFKDRDVLFLLPDFGNIIEENINIHKEVGLFTCLTNRVGCLKQCYQQEISENADIMHHYEIAEELRNGKRHDIECTDWVISGHVMVIQKRMWDKIGGAKDGLLGVDNYISKRILEQKMKIGILQGLYAFHLYRLHSHKNDTSHLK